MNDTQDKSAWWVYLVECSDGSYYTGCARDVRQRVSKHNTGKGAKYTRSRLPVQLVYCETQLDRSSALKREAEIKKLSHEAKKKLAEESHSSIFILY